MGILLRNPKPKLSDVQCSRVVFQPGDRVLVRVYHNLDWEQERKLRRTIQKWAGVDVEILIINPLEMELKIEHK